MPSPIRLLRPALLGTLLAVPSAQAMELLGVQPGMPRAEAARLLAGRFPAPAALQARLPAGQQPGGVQPLDPAGCPAQALCTASWSLLDADGRVQHREAVQIAIRQEQVMGLRHQVWQQAGAQCATALQQLRSDWQQSYAAPAAQQTSTRHGTHYLLQHWGECAGGDVETAPRQGLCLSARSGCSEAGELDSEISLTDYGRLRQ